MFSLSFSPEADTVGFTLCRGSLLRTVGRWGLGPPAAAGSVSCYMSCKTGEDETGNMIDRWRRRTFAAGGWSGRMGPMVPDGSMVPRGTGSYG